MHAQIDIIQTGAYLVLAGIMLCAALVFVALSIFYYEYVPMVEIEDKRNYSVLSAMMSINNVFAVHTVDIDEDEDIDRPRKSRRWTMHAISSKMNIEPLKTEL